MRLPNAYSKAARRRRDRHSRVLSRLEAARLRLPAVLGAIGMAELAVEEQELSRARRLELQHAPQRRQVRQSMLDRYLARGEISRGQYQDGLTLLQDWLASGLQPQITGIYDQSSTPSGPPVPGIGPGYSRYAAAMRAVGMILSPVLAHVVLHSLAASSWALGIGRPAGDGIAALRLALDALGQHYHRRRRDVVDELPGL